MPDLVLRGLVLVAVVGACVLPVVLVGRRQSEARRAMPSEWERYAAQRYFFAIDAPEGDVVATLLAAVSVATQPPGLGPAATYVESSGPDRVQWARGSRAFTDFRAVARTTSVDGRRGRRPGVVLSFVDVEVFDGVVAEFAAMRALKQQVLEALRGLEPLVEESVLPAV